MAENTPESDVGSIECFQNYTAPEVFIQGLAGIVDQQDVESMIRAQKQMLQRFEKTNEMLTNCNALSVNRLKSAGAEFKRHTQLLLDTKKDLDNIFKRIRTLKSKLSAQYPQAFAAAALERDHSVAETEDRSKPGLSRPKSCIEPSSSSSSLPPSDVAKTRPRSSVESAAGRNLDIREGDDEQSPVKRRNSSSTDSQNGNSNNDTSPCTSDTG